MQDKDGLIRHIHLIGYIRKVLLILFFVLFILPSTAYAGFIVKKENVSIEIPEHWIIQSHSTHSQIFSITKESIATISVFQFQFSEPITIKGFVEMRYQNAFRDGWLPQGKREGTDYESNRAGSDFSYLALYLKKGKIIGEYYFLRGSKGYILSIETSTLRWNNIEADLKNVIESFWIGRGPRLFIPLPESMNDEWLMIGKNAANNNNFNLAMFNFFGFAKKWEYFIENRDYSPENIYQPVAFKHQLFFNVGDQLICLSDKEGTPRWTYKTRGKIIRNLLIYDDILYFVMEGNINSLYAVFGKNGNILFKNTLDNQTYSNPIAAFGMLYLIDGQALRAFELDTGNPVWINQGPFNSKFYPVAHKSTILTVQGETTLCASDAISGSELWRKENSEAILYPPLVVHNMIILTTQLTTATNTSVTIKGIDIFTGAEVWRIQNPAGIKSIERMPAFYENQHALILGEMETDYQNKLLILILDIQTGKIQQQYAISDASGYSCSNAIITKKSIYMLRTLLETMKIQTKKDQHDDENPINTNEIEKREEKNTYLTQIDLETGKYNQIRLFKNHRFNASDILGFNLYYNGIMIVQNDPILRQISLKYLR